MQTVKKGVKLCHPLLEELEVLYSELSDVANKRLIPIQHDASFEPIVEIFNTWGKHTYDIRYVAKDIKKLKLPKYNPKNIIVCFSGGKDSFTVARHYQQLGYNVTLYHIRGLNATYCGKFSEHFMAEECAKYMGLPLVIEDIAYSGHHIWIEHPMKNMLMANRALSYGIREGITTKIAVGTFKASLLRDNVFNVCGGDCVEMWEAYDNVVKQFIPNYRTYISNRNYQTSYNRILKEPEVLEHTMSCMTPTRFRELFRNRTEKNYGIKLLPKRCGCCWKDALEYIWFVDHGVFELDRPYYVHCVEVLGDTIAKESTWRYYRVDEIWNTYFFYPLTKSKMYKELQDAFIQPNGKIIYSDNTTEG